ncbi:UPF0223 family protein [Streptococcus sciuri]|uniref:UPF0223 protein NXS10_01530 n=1 Tax=Streptococcus sciuri TaxID=2973939 RepID=A0ABT2F5A7_9STRE|nr:UPF0223 family protein [Streptococcus sciuri]MCS4487660.1 UPF0223 family protein [Streptococcus sciuri]
MNNNYAYPIDLSWSTSEVATVLTFLNQVEKAYESKVQAQEVLKSYINFKQIVKSKAQEKQIDRNFKKSSGYSTYRVVQAAKEKEEGMISLEK